MLCILNENDCFYSVRCISEIILFYKSSISFIYIVPQLSVHMSSFLCIVICTDKHMRTHKRRKAERAPNGSNFVTRGKLETIQTDD